MRLTTTLDIPMKVETLTIPFIVIKIDERDYLTSDGETITSDGSGLWG